MPVCSSNSRAARRSRSSVTRASEPSTTVLPRALEPLDRRRKAILVKRRALRADQFADDHPVHRRLVGDPRVEIGEGVGRPVELQGAERQVQALVSQGKAPFSIRSLIARSCDRRRRWSSGPRSARADRRRGWVGPPHGRRPRRGNCAPPLRYRRGCAAGPRSSARVTPASASCGMSEAASRLDGILEHMALYSRRSRNIPCTASDRAPVRPPPTLWMAKPPRRDTSLPPSSRYSTWLAGEQAPFMFGDLPVA